MGFSIGGGSSSSSSTSDSTNHSYTWNSGQIEDFMNNEFNSDIYYQGHNQLAPNAGQVSLFNYFTDPARYQSGQNIVNKGMGIAGQGMDILNTMRNISPDQAIQWIENTASGLYGDASGWQEQQNQNIEDNILVNYGNESAQYAESTQGAFGSGGANAHSAMAVGSEQSMESQEAALANKMMGAAVGMAGNAASMYGRTQGKAANALLNIGGGVIGAGVNSEKGAINNAAKMFNAQFVGNGINQALARNDNMVMNNLDLVEQEYWLKSMLQVAGIDTTSQTHTTGSASGSSKSGHMGLGR